MKNKTGIYLHATCDCCNVSYLYYVKMDQVEEMVINDKIHPHDLKFICKFCKKEGDMYELGS